MILKEIDKKENLQNFQKYGYEAEKQMAFYLKRAFQNDKNIQVIHDLRLVLNDDIAQIDHLIIHRFGFIIIESKSVTSKISVNEHEEWSRKHGNSSQGMSSPINQAIRQADFLKIFLLDSPEELLRKTILFKASISDFKFDVLVAISDSGIIERTKDTKIDAVFKADQITNEVQQIINSYEKQNSKVLTLSLKVNYKFLDVSMQKISDFLLQSHQQKNKTLIPKKVADISKTIVAPIEEKNDTQCKKCHSKNIEIAHGRYGYYFRCKDCKGSTTIKLTCKNASCKIRIRKEKQRFFQECVSCDTSILYFVNIESLDTKVT